jgi:DNA polymerase I-like protein with 3'-5' exonuclease and polymerase domains
LVKFVHDELVVMCPKRFGQEVAEAIGDAFKRAASERMLSVIMEFEYNIGGCWSK